MAEASADWSQLASPCAIVRRVAESGGLEKSGAPEFLLERTVGDVGCCTEAPES
jgi:NADPH-dependent glutamate synthase beta subunit-like oxidoreductase